MKQKAFGFNGVALTVPESWDLQSYYGNRTQGRLGLDNGEERLLDVSWAQCDPGDIAAIVAHPAGVPPDVVATAQERGRARDLGATVKELAAELESGSL